jgi:hypothetical protein
MCNEYILAYICYIGTKVVVVGTNTCFSKIDYSMRIVNTSLVQEDISQPMNVCNIYMGRVN